MQKYPGWARALPFATYMIFIAVQQGATSFFEIAPDSSLVALFYPLKIAVTTAVLLFFWSSYDELKNMAWPLKQVAAATVTGIIVLVIWVNLDLPFAKMDGGTSFNPLLLPGIYAELYIAVRLFGASLIVPIFEEIFWRSFLLRYIINPDFMKVKLGTFTWLSFILGSILFGLEHHLWLAGIIAGAIYALLLYRYNNLWAAIIAHGVTNLGLGIYVLYTGEWHFW